MPALSETRNQINGIESGLKQLRQSKMMRESEFKDMYSAIEQHHRDVRLAHLTGKPKDIQQQGEQDTRFFYILTKMLNEVQVAQRPTKEQRNNLQQVYAWYQGNKHILHSGPRFGRNKSAESRARPRSILKNSFGQMQLQSQLAQVALQQTELVPDSANVGSDQKALEQVLPAAQGDPEIAAIQRVAQVQTVSPSAERPQAPTPNKGLGIQKAVGSSDHLLPKRKGHHPLSHLYNPHSHPLGPGGEHEGATSPEVISTTLRLKISPKEPSSRTEVTPSGSKTEQMRRWDAFQQEQGYGQDMLSKLQYIGRSGVPQGVRYTAHEGGLMPEDHTENVVMNYAHLEEQKKGGPNQKASKPPNPLAKQDLEDFYEFTEGHYPHKLPKYPSFKPRTKSAPPGGRTKGAGSAQKNRAASAKSMPGKRCSSVVSQATDATADSGVKLDTVVSLIDSVTDELTYHKEKLAPDPQVGYRQPVVGMDPSDRPQTAPAEILAQAASSNWQDYMEDEMQEYERAEEMLAHLPMMEVVDWRGKVLPGSGQRKWKKGPFSDHSYVKKMSRPKSSKTSLRTAGSTRAGSRPKTAPVSAKKKWASEDAEKIDDSAASDMMRVQHLGGSSHRNRRRYLYYDFGQDMTSDTRPSTTSSPGMEYLSFITPKFMSGSRATSADFSSEHYFTDGNPPYPPNQSPSILDEARDYYGADLPPDLDSLTGDIDVPDMNDLDDDLGDLEDGQNFDGEEESNIDAEMASRSFEGHGESGTADPFADSKELLSEIHGLLQQEDNRSEHVDDMDKIEENSNKSHCDIMSLEDSQVTQEPNTQARPTSSVRKAKQHVAFVVDDNVGHLPHNSPAQSPSPKQSPGVSPRHVTVPHGELNNIGLAGMHLSGKPPGGYNKSGLPIVKPRSAPGGSRYISQSEQFPLMHPNELELDPFNMGSLQQRDNDSSSQSPRTHKQRLHVRAFPPSKLPAAPTKDENLSIKGMGRLRGEPPHQPAAAKISKPRARSAGSVPPRARSATHQRMLQRQQEMLKKAQASSYRTPPSIPNPYNQHGGRSPRVMQAYSAEMDAHARKDQSPRHFMEKVGVLRQGDDGRYGHSYESDEPESSSLTSSIRVVRLKFGSEGRREERLISPEPPNTPVQSEEPDEPPYQARIPIRLPPDGQEMEFQQQRPVSAKSLKEIGRPIPDYGEANDPDAYAAAVQLQKEAAAAVDIQRIFRGYVARNYCKHLEREERERKEDRQKAAVEIQRAFRGHLSRKKAIHNRAPDPESVTWAREYKKTQSVLQEHREAKADDVARTNARNKARADEKLAVIGPHVEVYDGFHPKKLGPTKAILVKAAIIVQKYVRRWLVMKGLAQLKRKGKHQAGSWPKMVSQYKGLLRRIQHRRGIERPVVPFSFPDMNDFMDTKKRYESVFDRRAFGGELDEDDLVAYFKECDLYPAKCEINEAVDMVMRGRDLKKGKGLQKHDVLDITFQLYPPKGSGIANNRQSTWMNPIIDGEEAVRLIGTDGVESTDFQTCWKITADSHRKRTQQKEFEMAQEEEREELAAKEKWKKQQQQERKNAKAKDTETEKEDKDFKTEPKPLDASREEELRAMAQERRQSRSNLWISELHDIQEVDEEEAADTNRENVENEKQKEAEQLVEE